MRPPSLADLTARTMQARWEGSLQLQAANGRSCGASPACWLPVAGAGRQGGVSASMSAWDCDDGSKGVSAGAPGGHTTAAHRTAGVAAAVVAIMQQPEQLLSAIGVGCPAAATAVTASAAGRMQQRQQPWLAIPSHQQPLVQVAPPVCLQTVQVTPPLLSSQSSTRSVTTAMEYPVRQQLIGPECCGPILSQEPIVMDVQLGPSGSSGTISEACSMTVFRHARSSSGGGVPSIVQPTPLAARCLNVGSISRQTQPPPPPQRQQQPTARLVGCKRPYEQSASDTSALKYPCITPHQHLVSRTTPVAWQLSSSAALTSLQGGAAATGQPVTQHYVLPHSSSRQHTPCNMLDMAPVRAPPAPRLLCHLSPSSLRNCCKVPSPPEELAIHSSLANISTKVNLQQLCSCRNFEQRPRVLTPCPSSLLLTTAHDYLAAALRLCGYTETRTLQLAVHMWSQVEHVVMAVELPALIASQRMQYSEYHVSDLRAVALLGVLWLAGKFEEQRVRQAKASVVWCLAPSRLQGLGPGYLHALEVFVMSLLGWSPYAGLQW